PGRAGRRPARRVGARCEEPVSERRTVESEKVGWVCRQAAVGTAVTGPDVASHGPAAGLGGTDTAEPRTIDGRPSSRRRTGLYRVATESSIGAPRSSFSTRLA